jgi:hypothetical protein
MVWRQAVVTLLWLLCIGHVACATVAELSALQDFYIATNGAATWDSGNSWDFAAPSPDPCTNWKGIQCTSGEITRLELHESSNLVGTLPESLSDLSNLQTL